jgi:hypothetical protein
MQSEYVWVIKKQDLWTKMQYSENAQEFEIE